MRTETLWLALALMLVLEGLLPFLLPRQWQNLLREMLKQEEGAIRLFGFVLIALGLALMWWL